MNEELKVLLTTAHRLESHRISYMISGSMAANYYTIPRMTRDIDIVIELKWLDVERFIKIFSQDFWIDASMVEQEAAKQGMFNLIHKEYFIKIDFILGKETDFQRSTFSRRKKVVIEDTPIWLMTAEDLILAKLQWAKDSLSELQLKDIKNLLKRNDLDQAYLGQWISHLKLHDIYQRVPHE